MEAIILLMDGIHYLKIPVVLKTLLLDLSLYMKIPLGVKTLLLDIRRYMLMKVGVMSAPPPNPDCPVTKNLVLK